MPVIEFSCLNCGCPGNPPRCGCGIYDLPLYWALEFPPNNCYFFPACQRMPGLVLCVLESSHTERDCRWLYFQSSSLTHAIRLYRDETTNEQAIMVTVFGVGGVTAEWYLRGAGVNCNGQNTIPLVRNPVEWACTPPTTVLAYPL